MDHHMNPTARQPLGDAMERLNHVTVSNISHQDQVGGDEKYMVLKAKGVTRGRSNPVVAVNYPLVGQREHRPPTPAPLVEAGPADPHLSAVANDSREAPDSRRVSQFFNASSNASSTRQLKTHIGPWQLGKTLGKGSSARVRLARHRVSHQLVAIKIVAKSTAHITQAGSLANLDHIDYRKPTTGADGGLRRMPLVIEREVAILKLIRHPNIIDLLDIWENRSEIYLVTEYVEKGDMFEFINWNGPLREEEAIFYFRQIMAALEYCHSFNICHRDLKPENILLKANGQIKVADFGMAALQQNPTHQLRTACGSPHYAAPELLRNQFYKGSAVDVWSMGVILFAMLAGRLPFDDDDMGAMLAKAERAEYKIPPNLSREAKDLIRRILVTQPAHRITMKQMWRHALIKKYDYLEEFQRWERGSYTVPRIMDNPPIPEEIDIQILRQLKALWHTYSESALTEKLRQDKPNDQKLFYWLLYNHREAQLENYNNNVPISKSDFHHLKPPNWCKRISTRQFTQSGRNDHARTVSRFTVISNVPDVDDSGTVRSYDPYNASRFLPPCISQASHARIIVHRNSPEPGVGQSPTSVSHSYRSYKSGVGSSRQRPRTDSCRTSTAGHLRSPQPSVSSIRSQHSTPRVPANTRSKRSVDFSSIRNKGHRHRRNRHDSLGAPASIAGDKSTYERGTLASSSPPRESQPHQVTTTGSMIDGFEPVDDSIFWNEELEQFGHRIVQDCDKAFRSSLLLPEPSEGGPESLETSPFTLSLGSLSALKLPERPVLPNEHRTSARPWDSRPLPPVPSKDTPSPLSIRNDGPMIERISQSAKPPKPYSGRDTQVAERRIVSEPLYNRTNKGARLLPSISENTPESSLETPTRVKNKGLDFLAKAENTIRVVNSPTAAGTQEPVKVPEPLNVRKVSQKLGKIKPALVSANRQSSSGSVPSKKRVSSWFKRSPMEDGSSSSFVTVTDTSVRSKEALGEAAGSRPSRATSQPTDGPSLPAPQKKKSFAFSFWKTTSDGMKMSIEADLNLDEVHIHGDKSTKKRSNEQNSGTAAGKKPSIWSDSEGGSRKIEVHQNWLARLFRVKPAMRYLCLNILKRRARQEVAILLQEWRRNGIKDVEVDKQRNIIFARVGSKNYLNLREVSFAVELMTVIEHGKRNQLSIARFTQEKGAASSFHKVVDAINSVFSTRGLLVADKRKINMMIKTLNS